MILPEQIKLPESDRHFCNVLVMCYHYCDYSNYHRYSIQLRTHTCYLMLTESSVTGLELACL